MSATAEPMANDEKEEGLELATHLQEARARLVKSLAAVAVAVGVAYLFAPEIYAFLVRPLAEASAGEQRRMIYTGLTEAFLTYIKLSFYVGLMLAFPYIMAQVYFFLAPGLYKREKRAFLPFIIGAPVLFLAGAALAYYYVFPMAWKFFLSFESVGVEGLPNIALEARVGEYLQLVIQLIFAFGLAFQLPLVLMLLVRAGLATPEGLKKKRKFALIGVLILAAFLTPPDVLSQIALAVPLYFLYEVSILLCQWVGREKGSGESRVARVE